ncbi:DNA adenine methylase [Lactococcus raffinolactis]|uniref:DNA adenine methylase n=1 Tax=Pseudolactococcus raffinolactis TaxID=1366 RepID=UPI001436AC63|nr:DNA adenine methylase [Lactococcus raffinolactis]QIW51209.1 DNA adenine methylase [Lactococcus raffinolactis]
MERVLNYPGSKWSSAERIINLFPKHKSYLEPFAGSLAVFLNKPPDVLETINDIDGRLINMWRVMRDQSDELARLVALTPYSRTEYELSKIKSDDNLEDARRILIKCWFSVGGKSDGGFRRNVRWTGPYNTQTWQSMPSRIIQAAERLRDAQIEQLDAIELIEKMNDDDTLIYADPPYMNETVSSKTHYKFGMADDQHLKLLSTLKNHRGPVILSGYNSDLYAEELKGWSKIEFDSATGNVGQKKKIAIECLWCNFDPVEQMNIFDTD